MHRYRTLKILAFQTRMGSSLENQSVSPAVYVLPAYTGSLATAAQSQSIKVCNGETVGFAAFSFCESD